MSQVLDDFARRERWRRLADRVAIGSPAVLIGAVLSIVLGAFGVVQVVLIVTAIIAVGVALAAYDRRDYGYLGPAELHALRNRPEGEAS